MIDKKYCMSSFLMFRNIINKEKHFADGIEQKVYSTPKNRIPVNNSAELEEALKKQMRMATADGKAALALSGGIDSAILAKFMPKGSTVYTFKCIVPGKDVTDESKAAAKYAEQCGLQQVVIPIYWDDFQKYMPVLMKHKGAPIHSIEVQIYKAALRAKEDGFEKLIFGESADCLYGGLSNVLSRDWTVGEFIDRYSFVLPYKVLKQFELITEPFCRFEKNGKVDVHEFYQNVFFFESTNSYYHALDCAGIMPVLPYANTKMNVPLDYARVRNGENKYLIREVFERLYPDFIIPPKTPMPRPVDEWLANWDGPQRDEFWTGCTENMTGDQKWYVYCLEKFLYMLDEVK